MAFFARIFPSCSFLLLLVIATNTVASSFDNQQKNSTIFDGIKGEQGELNYEMSQTTHTWRPSPFSKSPTPVPGFAFRKISGDFILTVQLKNRQQGQRRLDFGLQIEGGVADSFTLKTKLDAQGNLIVEASQQKTIVLPRLAAVKNPDVFQIERKESELIFSVANFGKPLQIIAHYNLLQEQALDVGIYRYFFAEDDSILEMRNLRWVIPAWKNLVPYEEYLGSRLEILDVVTGERKIIYETAAGIEAPNWTADGEYIIYNSSGRVYKLHLPSKKIALFNTGFEIKNNNDHVVSFKARTLGITHLEKGIKDKWIIYKLPINGGEPQQLTFNTPSYLHGWSPDGRYILYTGERNGQLDIFRTTADGVGEEIQLTNSKGLDDGAEYSPDGKYIYFNSSRSGAMRLWRMNSDGSNPQQITFDNFNDWFPHLSPDGKQIIFLSYKPDVAPDLHLYYQQVYLRIMPASGGEPKIIAYLYGGQGTINVPSWSPDGRYVAFMSNSQLGIEKP